MVEHSSGMGVDHIAFICSAVDGHGGCFHISVIVNSAAVNISLSVLTLYLIEFVIKFNSATSSESFIFYW